jgi:hypothetical protein
MNYTLLILLSCAQAQADLAGDLRDVAGRIPFLESGQLLHDRPPARLTRRLLSDDEADAVLRFRELAHTAEVV